MTQPKPIKQRCIILFTHNPDTGEFYRSEQNLTTKERTITPISMDEYLDAMRENDVKLKDFIDFT